MCNHYANDPEIRAELQTWREYIGWSLNRPLPPELQSAPCDVWPRQAALIVRGGEDGAYLDAMQWGVPLTLPGKRPGTTVTKRITNVRNLASPFWRALLANPQQRCLVPFSSFAEPKPNAGRAEVWFRVSAQPLSAFAGIWRQSDDGNVFAFLTCEPNPLVAPIHPKAMPVILQPEDYQKWLDGADAQALAQPFPSQLMAVFEAD
jgi:putative SOS response-associated peptidase YedK